MKRKRKFALSCMIGAACALVGLSLPIAAASAETVVWDLEKKTTTAMPSAFTSKQFDFWDNATVEFTENGVLATSKTARYNGNAMNIFAPFTVRGDELDFTLSIPLLDSGTGAFSNENYKCDNVAVTLYSGPTEVASVAIWGDTYNHSQQFVNATFTVGSVSVPEVKLSKKIMWESGGVKMGFSLEKGWMTELYNAAYAPVSQTQYTTALAGYSFDEITRIQIAGENSSTSLTSSPRVLLKKLNGQNLCGTTPQVFDDAFFMSGVEAADQEFRQGETYKFHIVGNPDWNGLNSGALDDMPKTGEGFAFGAFVSNLGKGKEPFGDVSWNWDGSKGPCKESGIYLTLHNPDGTIANFSAKSSWELSFSPEQAGQYTADFTVLTSNGFLCTRSCTFTVNGTAEAVSALIAAIDLDRPETATAARTAYDALTTAEQAKVGNAELLGQAERLISALASLKESFSMVKGASIRFDEPTGIRFGATLATGLPEAFAAEGVELKLGTLIAPVDLIGAGELTVGADFKHLDIVRTVYDKEPPEGQLQFNAAMIGIFPQNYGRSFLGRAYATFTFNGKTFTVYAAANDNVRSVADVATKALKAHEDGMEVFSPEQLEILRRYAGILENIE